MYKGYTPQCCLSDSGLLTRDIAKWWYNPHGCKSPEWVIFRVTISLTARLTSWFQQGVTQKKRERYGLWRSSPQSSSTVAPFSGCGLDPSSPAVGAELQPWALTRCVLRVGQRVTVALMDVLHLFETGLVQGRPRVAEAEAGRVKSGKCPLLLTWTVCFAFWLVALCRFGQVLWATWLPSFAAPRFRRADWPIKNPVLHVWWKFSCVEHGQPFSYLFRREQKKTPARQGP